MLCYPAGVRALCSHSATLMSRCWALSESVWWVAVTVTYTWILTVSSPAPASTSSRVWVSIIHVILVWREIIYKSTWNNLQSSHWWHCVLNVDRYLQLITRKVRVCVLAATKTNKWHFTRISYWQRDIWRLKRKLLFQAFRYWLVARSSSLTTCKVLSCLQHNSTFPY